MEEQTMSEVLDSLEKDILKETDLDIFFKLGLRLVENKTMWYRRLEKTKDQTSVNGNIARIAVLMEIWNGRKELLLQKAKTEGDPNVVFNKKFRHEAQQFLSPDTYRAIVNRVNNGK